MKDLTPVPSDTEQFRDHIATVDEQGKRIWIYPKKPKGYYYNVRSIFSWILLAFLFGMPFIKLNGDPFMLFNVLERRFIIFGINFMPQDFYLFVIAMLIFMIFIVLFTVVFGRLFCGWICPQTIFMEMVFRKIEYWIEGDANAQKRLNKAPWTTDKVFKKVSKQAIFFGISILIANTFLAYIISMDEVIQIVTEPIAQHMVGFIAMIIFSFVFYFVFSYMREQVCIAICPYGRLQSVMLDKDSIVVAYDFIRGEPRGKIKKSKKKQEEEPEVQLKQNLGDCIDCSLCVQVCPTGIDIRNGTQLECVNCTACMDACDEVMLKIGREKKLIRYDSTKGIEEGRKKMLTPRVMAYSGVLSILIILEIFLFALRTDVETLLLRTPGLLFQEVNETTVSNLYNYQVINKTPEEYPIEFRLESEYGAIKLVGEAPFVKKNEISKGGLFIEMPKDKLKSGKNMVTVGVYSNGKLIDKVETSFLGPVK